MPLYLLGITRSRELAGIVVGPQPAPPEPAVHSHVLMSIHCRADLLPVRLGLALPNEDAVRAMLCTAADELMAALDRLKGACEIGLRIHFNHKQPYFPDNTTTTASTSDYLSLRRARYAWEDALNKKADSVASRYIEAIHGLYRQWQRLMPAPLGVVRLALLVDRHRCDTIRHRLETIHAIRQAEHCTLLGPWPPYSFV
jgi:hypothetical protein